MNALETVLGYLTDLSQHGFWGFITVKFENGHPVHFRREENLKPSALRATQLPETNRRDNNASNNTAQH
jgi:hypothetical protein